MRKWPHLEMEADEAKARGRRQLKARVLAHQLRHGLRQADVVPEQAQRRLSTASMVGLLRALIHITVKYLVLSGASGTS